MSQQLKNILRFVTGGPTSLPHNLNWNGRPVRPDLIELSTDTSGVSVTADETNVTINASVTVDILVESWHTIERTFNDRSVEELAPQPFVVGQGVPTPAFINEGRVFIYARPASQGGSDTTGNGRSIATAYRTWQRAIRDVPMCIPPGVKYYVDCTGIDPEVLPDNFALPAWKAPEGFNGDAANPFFLVQTAVNMIAIPRLVASLGANATINPGDIVSITQNPISGQVAIKTNKTFPLPLPGPPPTGGLVGKILHGSAGFFENAVIYDNTVDTIFLTLDFPPTAPLQIMEQSAELITNWTQRGFSGGLNVCNVDSCSFMGFDIHPIDAGNGNRGFFQYGGTCWLTGCNLRAPVFVNPTRQANIDWTNLDGDIDGSGTSATFWEAFPYHAHSRLVNLTGAFYGPQIAWGTNIYGGTVYDSCDPIGTFGVVGDFYLSDVLIRNARAEGLVHHSGFLEPYYLAFENCASNAILVTGGEALLSGKIGGTGWTGAALKVIGGANVTLQPFGPDMAFDAPGDTMEVGTLPPRLFSDFRSGADGGFVQQMLDVTAFNGTPATFGAAGTGSRVSENS